MSSKNACLQLFPQTHAGKYCKLTSANCRSVTWRLKFFLKTQSISWYFDIVSKGKRKREERWRMKIVRNLYRFGGKYSGIFYIKNAMENNSEITGIGKYGGGQNSFRRFFSPDVSSANSVSKIICSARAFAAFLWQRIWMPHSRAAKRCRTEHRKLENSLTEYHLEENEDESNAGVREKKKKKFCIFFTVTDGFLILQHFYRDSTILIPLQAQYFLLLATLLRRAKQSRMPMARAGKTLCCPIHQNLPHPLLFFPFLFWCFSFVVNRKRVENTWVGGEGERGPEKPPTKTLGSRE